jgi:hypothetical protein
MVTAGVVTKLSRETSAAAAFDGLGADSKPQKSPVVMPRLQLHGKGLFHILFSIRLDVLRPSMRFLGHICFWISTLVRLLPPSVNQAGGVRISWISFTINPRLPWQSWPTPPQLHHY